MPSLPQVLARASALGHLTADVVLRTVGVERNFGPLEHHQQLGLVGVEASEQPVEGDEAGAAGGDAGEASPQGGLALLGRVIAVSFEIAGEAPTQRAGA